MILKSEISQIQCKRSRNSITWWIELLSEHEPQINDIRLKIGEYRLKKEMRDDLMIVENNPRHRSAHLKSLAATFMTVTTQRLLKQDAIKRGI